MSATGRNRAKNESNGNFQVQTIPLEDFLQVAPAGKSRNSHAHAGEERTRRVLSCVTGVPRTPRTNTLLEVINNINTTTAHTRTHADRKARQTSKPPLSGMPEFPADAWYSKGWDFENRNPSIPELIRTWRTLWEQYYRRDIPPSISAGLRKKHLYDWVCEESRDGDKASGARNVERMIFFAFENWPNITHAAGIDEHEKRPALGLLWSLRYLLTKLMANDGKSTYAERVDWKGDRSVEEQGCEVLF